MVEMRGQSIAVFIFLVGGLLHSDAGLSSPNHSRFEEQVLLQQQVSERVKRTTLEPASQSAVKLPSMIKVDVDSELQEESKMKRRNEPDAFVPAYQSPEVLKYLDKHWTKQQKNTLVDMFRKTVWHSLQTSAIPLQRMTETDKLEVFLQAGDFPYFWSRDSIASIWHFFTTGLVDKVPRISEVVQGLVRMNARFLTLDASCCVWRQPKYNSSGRFDVCWDTKNELDEPIYFLRLVRHSRKHRLPVVDEEAITNAVKAVIAHLASVQSSYGLLHTDSRPSDNGVPDGFFHVPDNFFALEELTHIHKAASLPKQDLLQVDYLISNISDGLQRYASSTNLVLGQPVYCYEVNPETRECNPIEADDANLPSLLSLPYMSPSVINYTIYKDTRNFILSRQNKYWFTNGLQGDSNILEGEGSNHTPSGRVWHLGVLAEGLTTANVSEVVKVLSILTRSTNGTNLMHEAWEVTNPANFSRGWFDWPNSLLAELLDGCCKDLVLAVDSDAYKVPDDPFKNWTTCSFNSAPSPKMSRSGPWTVDNECVIGDVARQSLFPAQGDAMGNNSACLRFGTTFSGFVYKVVKESDFPIQCSVDQLGQPPPLENCCYYFPDPLHCAVGSAELCPS